MPSDNELRCYDEYFKGEMLMLPGIMDKYSICMCKYNSDSVTSAFTYFT